MKPSPVDRSWWINRYAEVSPMGHLLRKAFDDRWLRIHSLPDTQRYPADDEDWQTLKARHRRVCDAVMQPQQHSLLIVPSSCVDDPCFGGFELKIAHDLPGFQAGPDSPVKPFCVAEFRWDFDAFLPVLEEVAQWQTFASVFLIETSFAYCPYDGGADLIFGNSGERDRFREVFADLLSPFPSGL